MTENLPNFSLEILGHSVVQEIRQKRFAEIVHFLDVGICQTVPTLRLLPEKLRNDVRVEVADQLHASRVEKHVSCPLQGACFCQNLRHVDRLMFVAVVPGVGKADVVLVAPFTEPDRKIAVGVLDRCSNPSNRGLRHVGKFCLHSLFKVVVLIVSSEAGFADFITLHIEPGQEETAFYHCRLRLSQNPEFLGKHFQGKLQVLLKARELLLGVVDEQIAELGAQCINPHILFWQDFEVGGAEEYLLGQISLVDRVRALFKLSVLYNMPAELEKDVLVACEL